jgi:hypothetical protein
LKLAVKFPVLRDLPACIWPPSPGGGSKSPLGDPGVKVQRPAYAERCHPLPAR